jgi:hypothetical protein
MGSFFQRKRVRAFLSLFRWCRVALLMALLLVVAAVTYLHQIGLPDYLKRPLLRQLREKGFEVQFSNARLGWGPSVVIDNCAFSRAGQSSGPRLSAGMVQLAVKLKPLLRSRLEVDSFSVTDGQLRLPLSGSNGDALSLDNVNVEVALLSNNVAQLRTGAASFRGVEIRLSGQISDVASLRNWKSPFRIGQATPEQFQARLRRAAEMIRQIHLNGSPHLDLMFAADGGDMNSLRADLRFAAREAATPWGEAGQFELRAAFAHMLNSGRGPLAQVRVSAERVATPWGGAGSFRFSADLSRDASTNLQAAIHFDGSELEAKWKTPDGSNGWGRAASARWDGEAALIFTNRMPASLAGTLRAAGAQTPWGSAASLDLSSTNLVPESLAGTLRAAGAQTPWGSASSLDLSWQARRTQAAAGADAAWGPWKIIWPYSIDWQAAANDVRSPKLEIETAALEGRWSAPDLAVRKARVRLYDGNLDCQASLNAASREVRLHAAADFDPHKVAPLLTSAAQHWISQFDWAAPPQVTGDLSLVLPPWTNRPDGWLEAFRSSIALAGDFTVGPGSFRGVAADSAASHFSYTNRVWNLPLLRAARSEGGVEMTYTGNEATHDYYFKVNCSLDPADVRDWLQPAQQSLLDEVKISQPPQTHVEVWGNWRNREALGFSGTVAAGKFAARGQSFDSLQAALDYTNHFLRVVGLRAARGAGTLSAPLVTADFEAKRIVLTNIESTLELGLARQALGTNTPHFLSQLSFEKPPTVRVSGSFQWDNPLATDVRFHVEGESFRWTNLTAETITGEVHWLARTVFVTNVQAGLYKTGRLGGWITFDYVPRNGCSFRSDLTARNIDLSALIKGLNGRSNRVEGLLDGHLALAAPLGGEKKDVTGIGYVYVHDALLWDIKVFGIFSPVLNLIAPGAGESRAREAMATFAVANGEVTSDDLQILAPGYRLLYRGKVSLDKQIDARVEADLLRDTPLLGRLLSLVLTPLGKIFEYHISGSTLNPSIEPVYIPNVLMMVLRPFHTLKSILPEAPAQAPPEPAKPPP